MYLYEKKSDVFYPVSSHSVKWPFSSITVQIFKEEDISLEGNMLSACKIA